VEAACARAQERSSADSREIGAGIRRVVAAWNNSSTEAGLLLAQELRRKFPKNGDVANVLAQALLRMSPPRWSDADRELEAARRLGCSKPELVLDAIKTKTELQDWQGLYELTRKLTSNSPSRDVPLNAIAAVEKIMAKTSRQRLDQALFNTLASMRFEFAREYVAALEHLSPRAGDKLKVFEGTVRLADAGVFLFPIVKTGLSALQTWWGDVERRPVVDLAACGILSRQLSRLENIERQLVSSNVSSRHVATISNARRDLAYRGAKLSAS